ncbi:hypothetical protein BH10ACI2_BH10ACI2_07030 [soil metagenome]
MIEMTETVSNFRPKDWKILNRFPSLLSGNLHVCSIKIDRSQEHIFKSCLSTNEVKRAMKFRHPEDRADFVVCRGVLRRLLGEYVGIEPGHVEISYTRDGKPFVDQHSTNIKFNISHSHEIALFAFSKDFDLGIDIERLDVNIIDPGMISHCLHPNEIETFQALEVDKKAIFFFNCWTGKEAYLKLRGDGFAVSPSEIDLASIRETDLSMRKTGLHFSQPPPIEGYASVVATKDRPRRINYFKLGSSLFK